MRGLAWSDGLRRGSLSAMACILGSCSAPEPLVTQAEYDAIEVGMHWELIADAIPTLPSDMLASSSGVDDSQTFYWRNSDGTTAAITERAGVVSSKMQFGALPRHERDFCSTAKLMSPDLPRQRCK